MNNESVHQVPIGQASTAELMPLVRMPFPLSKGQAIWKDTPRGITMEWTILGTNLQRIAPSFQVGIPSTTLTLERFEKEVARCKRRLDGFYRVRDGWYNGDGTAPSLAAIAVANLLLDHKPRLASFVGIFPLIEGGVLFEFKYEKWDYSIEIDNRGDLELLGVEVGGLKELGPRKFSGHDAFRKFLDQLKRMGV